MAETEKDYFRRRAEAEIAIAHAAGCAKAHASSDNRTVFIERRDGTRETVQLRRPQTSH